MNKDDFPMLAGDLVYLDTAATAQKPQCVIDAVNAYYSDHCGTVHRGVYDLAVKNTDRYHQVRQKVANFIGATSESEIIFTKGTTEALNLLAHTLGQAYVEMGDDVVISEIEHHANIVPWQLMCEARGANLRILPVDDNGDIILEACEQILSHRTKIVSIGHISNAIGTIHPIAQLTTLAHEVGALMVVDGAQAAPHLPIDVQALDVDFYTFSGHKAYGPTGTGILYGKYSLLETLPPYQGGGDMISEVTFEETTYNDIPVRFEAGTPNIAGIFGLGAAIDYLQSLDRDALLTYEANLLSIAKDQLSQIPGLTFIGSPTLQAPILSFVVDNCHPLDIGTLLSLQNIAVRTGHHCAQPAMNRFGVTHTIRASLAPYNTPADIDALATALTQITTKLQAAD